jgi:hypothetical protein
MYFMKVGDCANGAPRFSLWLDPAGSTEVWVYFGPTTYGGPGCAASPWASTGNLAGSPAIGQSSNSVFVNTPGCGNGNTAYTWAGAVACLGASTKVYYISADVDGGAPVTENQPNGYSQDTLFKCDSITINTFVFPPCSVTRGVPEFPSGVFALLALAVPALLLLRTRFVAKTVR